MSIFSIGVTGLGAAQTALQSTSSNISNVHTPGYNREVVKFGENLTGGVRINDVERQFSLFVSSRLNASEGSMSALETYKNQVSQIDNLLSDQDAGLAPMLQKFFGSLTDVSGNPSDPAARQGVIGTASTLAAQFRSFDNYLNDIQRSVNGQIRDEVTQINNLADQIAMLNNEISRSSANQTGAPNGLLNQRDHAVAELNKIVDAQVVVQRNGSYNVTVGTGQPLVAGTQSYGLEAMQSSSDPMRMVVGYRDGTGNVQEYSESSFRGGRLGGLMQFRNESLDRVQNQLGQLATAMAAAFNEQHAQGVDLNGEAGKDFFSVHSPETFVNTFNTGNATLSASIVDGTEVAASGYDVTFDGTDYQVRRRDDGREIDANFDAGPPNTLNFGGMTVEIAGTAEEGDRFRIEPVKRAAGNFELLLSETSEIAAAASNLSGDNTNALAMMELQTASVVGGTASFNQAYSGIISDAGNRISVVNANLSAQQGLTEQLRMLQQSESGVNLDEEATNLIKYQQYYQANAKVIETGATVLDTILGLRA